ncbi:MAG: transporter [Gammaproteobacteria bacterium]|nr:transporter [Gammaproteobacteria bacterium]
MSVRRRNKNSLSAHICVTKDYHQTMPVELNPALKQHSSNQPGSGRNQIQGLPRIACWIAALLLFSGTGRLKAQEIEPLTLSNTPTGVNLFGVGMGFSQGNVLLDPSLPIENLDGDMVYGVLRYVRTFGLLGRSAKFAALLPFTSGDWDGEFEGSAAQRSAAGFGDLRLTLGWTLHGAPALKKSEMGSYRERAIIGGSIRLIVPTGEYDSTKLINLGSNRWSVRGEAGLARTLGAWKLEGFGAVWVYGKNDNFVGLQQEQENIYVIKAHAIYRFRPGFWIGFGAGYGNGGRTKVNGVARDNRQENWRFGATITYPLNTQHGVSLTMGTGINRGAGGDFDTLAVAYQYAWGDI